jgi:catechol 2,3-dioxygenase-like lactoylglutathione lyase family enzyme
MKQYLSAVSVVVPDYDQALAFYVGVLGFDLCEDKALSPTKRWITLAPPGAGAMGCRLLLAKAANEAQRCAIGNQTGGRVFLFLTTDDFDRDHARMSARGVRFREEPRIEPYGRVAVFEDPFGNAWDLVEPS